MKVRTMELAIIAVLLLPCTVGADIPVLGGGHRAGYIRDPSILDGAKQQMHVVAWDATMGVTRPKGKGVCTDVILDAFAYVGMDLADSIRSDVRQHRSAYRFAEGAAIDARRARVQIDWFRRHAEVLPLDGDFQAGDIVFFTGTYRTDGAADHVAIVADEYSEEGPPKIIDNFPTPGYVSCTRDVTFVPYTSVRLIGHFRFTPSQ